MILKLVAQHLILLATSGTQNNVPLCELPYLSYTFCKLKWNEQKNNEHVTT